MQGLYGARPLEGEEEKEVVLTYRRANGERNAVPRQFDEVYDAAVVQLLYVLAIHRQDAVPEGEAPAPFRGGFGDDLAWERGGGVR